MSFLLGVFRNLLAGNPCENSEPRHRGIDSKSSAPGAASAIGEFEEWFE
jgi:hypothetical protein